MIDPEIDRGVWGLDVSHHQGAVDWARVAQSGYRFAFIKATQGVSWTDPEFKANWAGTREVGVLRGAYHFYVPGKDPEEQAEHFLRTVWPHGGFPLLVPGELPPVLDIEIANGQSAAEVVRGIQVWLSLVRQSTLRIPIIHTRAEFWNNLQTAEFGAFPLWVTHYGVLAPSPLPAGWWDWRFWQISKAGKVEGIRGRVDLDVFHGCFERLLQMAAIFSNFDF
jgi:lysozyme